MQFQTQVFTYVTGEVEVAIRVGSAKAGGVRLWLPAVRGSDGRREFQRTYSGSWCVYDCQNVGANLTVPDGFSVSEGDAQTTKGEKSKSKEPFQYRTRRRKDGIELLTVLIRRLWVFCELHNGCCWVARFASDPGPA